MKPVIFLIILLISSSLYTQSNDSAAINYNFIDSYPQNAGILSGNEIIGYTPLYFMWQDSIFPKTLKVSLKGYSEETFTVQTQEKISRKFILNPLKPGLINDPVKENKQLYFKTPRKLLPIVVSSVITAASGIGSFYFKSLASDNKKEYELSGDLAALDNQKKYDLLGGISIVALQLGFGALMYFLFID